MIAGTPAGTLAAVRTWRPTGRRLWWLARSRLSNGEVMPDRAALIEEQIPGLRRFACALLRDNREGADDLVQDTLERALAHRHLRRNQGNLRGWLYTILYNRFLSDQHRVRRRGPHDALSEETELPGIDGGQHSVLEHRDLLRAVEPCRRGTKDLEEGGCLSRLSGWRKAVRKMRAIPAAGRLQDGRGFNQPAGLLPDLRTGPAIMRRMLLRDKFVAAES